MATTAGYRIATRKAWIKKQLPAQLKTIACERVILEFIGRLGPPCRNFKFHFLSHFGGKRRVRLAGCEHGSKNNNQGYNYNYSPLHQVLNIKLRGYTKLPKKALKSVIILTIPVPYHHRYCRACIACGILFSAIAGRIPGGLFCRAHRHRR